MEQISNLMETAARARSVPGLILAMFACIARHSTLVKVGATEMNASSSRSHSIFALYLHGVNREQHSARDLSLSATGLSCPRVELQELHGALHLVDLAGSERLDKPQAEVDNSKEDLRMLACYAMSAEF